MDGYPEDVLHHNVPFLVASGLQDETSQPELDAGLEDGGTQIQSSIQPLQGKEADVLRGYFEEIDTHGESWAGVGRGEPYRFRIKTVGRSFTLPARRAKLPEPDEDEEETDVRSPPVLHSPFSPLSPASGLYPDGLIDSRWVKKHQSLVPSIFACFYNFTTAPAAAGSHDAKLRADVNGIKAALVKSGYKTRLILVLLGDDGASSGALPEGVQERLELIRREAGLDPKSIFYIPPQESPGELKQVIGNIMGVFYGMAIEYYRDLGRHARKKRSRGVVPQPTVPPTGTSHTLSLPDWNFRYDFKAGVFAEFRQETDAALRSFEQAYEILLGADVLDVIPNWSPRWNEARQLSDLICIRCLRINFWMGQTSLAVRRWQAHRDRIGDFVDRRGMGTHNYSWEAWEARWAMVMASLIEQVGVPGLAPSSPSLFLEPEKNLLGERLQPWELLHHTGYWYKLAASHLTMRRALARRIPEEDREAPNSSATTPVAAKALSYDTYMCPEPYNEMPMSGPGVNHAQLILDCLRKARGQFQIRQQSRTVAELSLCCAQELTTLESWAEAIVLLEPLWRGMLFRGEQWLDVFEELCWVLRRSAVKGERADLVVAIDWELMSRKYKSRKGWNYDLSKSLANVSPTTPPSISLNDESVSSPISAAFAFRNKQNSAGETCLAQLSLTSDAHPDAAPVTLKSVTVGFAGSIKPIVLSHDEDDAEHSTDKIQIISLKLKEEFTEDTDSDLPSELTAPCDLTLQSGQTRVYEMMIPLREAGEATASSVQLSYRNDDFDLEYTLNFRETDQATGWYVAGQNRPRYTRSGAQVLEVLPRPPKLEIKVENPMDQHYANELIELQVELLNLEDESATAKLDIHVFGKDVPSFSVKAGDEERTTEGAPEAAHIAGLSLGKISSSASSALTLVIQPTNGPTSLEVHLRASYHLESDATTPIVQMVTHQMTVSNAFEANYDLVPRLHPDPWPSLFNHSGLDGADTDADASTVQARGFAQKWCLMCHYASFAHENLTVVGMETKVVSCVGGARCTITKSPEAPDGGIAVATKTMHEAQFDLAAQKLSLDDRHPVSLELAFVIKWKREKSESDRVNTTTMLVGKYLVLGTEPRVLASVLHGSASASHMMQLDITIENPSNHFLTFGLGMDPSDEFAFSGAKQTTLHLLPMSRRTSTYRLVPLVHGAYVRPNLVVRDKYFQKVLRIIPTEGMKIDKEGLLIWVPGDGVEEKDQVTGDEGGHDEEEDGEDESTAS